MVTAWIKPMKPTVKMAVAIITSTKVKPTIDLRVEADCIKAGDGRGWQTVYCQGTNGQELSGQTRSSHAGARAMHRFNTILRKNGGTASLAAINSHSVRCYPSTGEDGMSWIPPNLDRPLNAGLKDFCNDGGGR